MPETYAFVRMPRAYPRNHGCTLANGSGAKGARLIDIGSDGARVRLDAPGGADLFHVGLGVRLDARLGGALRRDCIECVVAWTNGPELGLVFAPSLDLAVRDLQDALADPSARDAHGHDGENILMRPLTGCGGVG